MRAYIKFTGTAVLLFSSLLAVSCGSTTKVTKAPPVKEVPPAEVAAPAEPVIPVPTAKEIYEQKVNGTVLSVVSIPAETMKGRAFTKPYVIKAVNSEKQPAANFDIATIVPFTGERIVITTGEDGTASFMPPVPLKPADTTISFFPDGNLADSETTEYAKSISVTAPYKVQTDMKGAGGVIAVVDFNQNDKPITSNPVSSSNLLMSLMKLGFKRIGNIDLTKDVLNDDTEKLLKNAKAMVGNTSVFLIYGTVKYESTEKTDAGTKITLVGSLKCLNLKTGALVYASIKKATVTDKNEWNALAAARKELSDQFAQEIKYGI